MGRIRTIFDWITRLASLAVLLVLAGILALVVINQYRSPPPPRPVEQVAGAELGKELHLGDFEELPGSSLLYAALSTGNPKYRSSFGPGGGDCNLLFFDPGSKRGHWLLPGNDQTIRSHEFLTDPPGRADATDPDHKVRTVALLLDIEQPSKDGGPAQRHLAIADADDRHILILVDGIDDVLGWHQVDGQSVLVFYTAGGVARIIDYDIAGRRVRSDGALSAEEQ